MPQLDIVTFFSQFFWLSIFYVGFYYILYKYFLPQYSRSILLRDKLTHSSIQGTNIYESEKGNIEQSLYGYTLSAVGFSKNFFAESKKNTGDWHKLCVKNTNEGVWKGANLLYIKSFGKAAASKKLCGNCISYAVGRNLYMESLSEICVSYTNKCYGQKILNKNSSPKSFSTVEGEINMFKRKNVDPLANEITAKKTLQSTKLAAKEDDKQVKGTPPKKSPTLSHSKSKPGTRKSASSKK